MYLSPPKGWRRRPFLACGADSCHTHVLPTTSPRTFTQSRWTDERITKGPGGEGKSSSYSLGLEAHHSILQPVKVGLFISKDQHISLLQAPTPFLCPIFSLSVFLYSFLFLTTWQMGKLSLVEFCFSKDSILLCTHLI